MARPRTAVPESPASLAAAEARVARGRTTILLPPAEKRRLSGLGRTVTGAVRQLIQDGLHLFGLPQPFRVELEADMRAQGMASQRDYIVWLLLERREALSRLRNRDAA